MYCWTICFYFDYKSPFAFICYTESHYGAGPRKTKIKTIGKREKDEGRYGRRNEITEWKRKTAENIWYRNTKK